MSDTTAELPAYDAPAVAAAALRLSAIALVATVWASAALFGLYIILFYAIGSWLYRMEYGFWFLTAGDFGHDGNFSGWFDHVMAFFFYLPNLAVAEAFIRARAPTSHPGLRMGAAALLAAATLLIALASWEFAGSFWLPGMARRL